MHAPTLSRRQLLAAGSATVAILALLNSRFAQAAPLRQAAYAWTFWSFNWAGAEAGEHTVTSRAIDTSGNMQPVMDDPKIAQKITYWESNGQITRKVQIG